MFGDRYWREDKQQPRHGRRGPRASEQERSGGARNERRRGATTSEPRRKQAGRTPAAAASGGCGLHRCAAGDVACVVSRRTVTAMWIVLAMLVDVILMELIVLWLLLCC